MAGSNRKVKGKEQQEPKKEPVKDFLKDLVFVLVSFFFLNSFVLASFEVPTGSMENEIMAGDFLFVNKFIYGGTTPRTIPFTNVRLPWFRVPAFRDVRRGDVIVFEFPGQREEIQSPEFMFYLKRCVALSGDTIQVINRILYVNGKPSPIPRNMKFNNLNPRPQGYADPKIFPRDAAFNEDFWGPVVVPRQGDVLDLNSSTYARWNTFIAREGHRVRLDERARVTVDGVPATTYVVRRNYLFGMGDNRDNSLDSRFWGFIPEENIVGTPMIVYWSWDPDRPLTSLVDKIASIRLGRIGTLIR
ncbi:MAG TPA: signal peptidase I [Bacteroidota bacterium]|nr:signal peptidase I [Bacteroidota bacterium]